MLLILLLFNFLPCSIIATTMKDLPPSDFVPGINDLRRKYAKQYNVPNMHGLIWSEDLLNILKLHDWSSAWPDARKTWRYTDLQSYETALSQIETDLNDFLKKTAEEIRTKINHAIYSMSRMEFINPLQRFIACTPKPQYGAFVIVCLVGTEGSFTMFDTTGQSTGIPGFGCHKRYENEDGLCVATNPEEESYRGHREDFIEDINEIRRRYADSYYVPNMHELMWSEDLLDILKPLDWHGEWPESRRTWRFAYIDCFDVAKLNIEKEMKILLGKNGEAGKQDHINGHDGGTFGIMEFLNPLQKFVACGSIIDSSTNLTVQVCLLGPQGGVRLFDTSGQIINGPGSDCERRYMYSHMLCAAHHPEEESYRGRLDDFEVDINDIRRVYADRFNVPNMHALIKSEDLLKILEPLDWDDDWPESQITWRYARVDSFDGAERNIEKEMNILLGKNGEAGKQEHINGHNDDSFGIMEFLNPLQKFFACALINDTSTNLTVQICLLGPQGRVALFDTSKNQSNYVPGSKCDRRYKNDKKLCVALSRREESYQGSQEDFVEDVNQIRNQYAYKFSVHNMHQLIWSEDLVKTLESFEYTNPRPDAPQTTWRYTAITTYSEKPYIEYGLKKFFEDSVESQEKQIDEQVDKTVWLLEFLNPRQKFIGCGPKPDGNRIVIVCLMGPEGNYTHLNSTRLSIDAPESECDDGYKRYKGLCSIPTTTTTEKPDERSDNMENPPQETKQTAAPQVASAGNQIHKFYVVIFVVSWLFAF